MNKANKHFENELKGKDYEPDSRVYEVFDEAIQIALNEQALRILDEILRQSIKEHKGLGIEIAGGNLALIILKDTNLDFRHTNPIWYKHFPKDGANSLITEKDYRKGGEMKEKYWVSSTWMTEEETIKWLVESLLEIKRNSQSNENKKEN